MNSQRYGNLIYGMEAGSCSLSKHVLGNNCPMMNSKSAVDALLINDTLRFIMPGRKF